MRMYFSIVMSVLGLCAGVAYAGSPGANGITLWGPPVPDAQLDTQRGGTDTGPITIDANILNATLYNNAASNNVTGHNTITGNAFTGASGFPLVFQNSGNNVIMQSGTVLNLTLK